MPCSYHTHGLKLRVTIIYLNQPLALVQCVPEDGGYTTPVQFVGLGTREPLQQQTCKHRLEGRWGVMLNVVMFAWTASCILLLVECLCVRLAASICVLTT